MLFRSFDDVPVSSLAEDVWHRALKGGDRIGANLAVEGTPFTHGKRQDAGDTDLRALVLDDKWH